MIQLTSYKGTNIVNTLAKELKSLGFGRSVDTVVNGIKGRGNNFSAKVLIIGDTDTFTPTKDSINKMIDSLSKDDKLPIAKEDYVKLLQKAINGVDTPKIPKKRNIYKLLISGTDGGIIEGQTASLFPQTKIGNESYELFDSEIEYNFTINPEKFFTIKVKDFAISQELMDKAIEKLTKEKALQTV